MKNSQSIGDISNSNVENSNVCDMGCSHHSSRDPRETLSKSWILGLSIFNTLLLIAGIILVSIGLPADYALDFDYYGVIIGVLSIFITVLVGWNIYSAVDVNRTVSSLKNDFSSLKNEFSESFKTQKLDIEEHHHYSEMKSSVNLMNAFIYIKDSSSPDTNNNSSGTPIDYYVVYYGVMGAVNGQKLEKYNNVNKVLDYLVSYLKDNNSFTLTVTLLNNILSMLHQIDSSKYKQVIVISEKLVKLTSF